MRSSAWPSYLVDEYAKRLRVDPENHLASYFLDVANHISSSTLPKGKRYWLGYVSVVARMILFFKEMLLVNAAQISTDPINAVWLITPAHADTMEAFLGRKSPSNMELTICHQALDNMSPLHVVLASLPQTIDIFVKLCRNAPRRLRNRVELFEFILQVICSTRFPLLNSVATGPCVLTYEVPALNKAVALITRRAGERVIHVMHGQRLPAYQVTMATDLVLFSKVDENWFRERVDPQVRIWTTGHPRLEATRAEVGLPEINTSSRPSRIAFFSQPVEGDYSRELRLRDWRILAGLKGRAEVRFRLHPREDRETAVRDLKAIGADFIELSDAGLKEDLTWCDAVASSWSTVSMEAAACGRGVFWTCATPEKYEASRELQDAGIGVLVRDATDWNPYLDAWNHGGWQPPVIVPEHQLQALGMIGDMDRPWLERLGIEPSNVE